MSHGFYPEPNDSANRNDLLVEPMNKMCGIVAVLGIALSGCAIKTPEKPEVTPPPAVVQQEAPEAATPAPAQSPARYEAAPANASAYAAVPYSPQAAEPEQEPESETKLNQNRAEQCRKELDVLKVYNKASYDKYEVEYQAIASKTAKYMEVKDSLGADLNYMVMPAYQFQIREFCFRVKTRLSELVLRQAK
ncbi:MULTISPECIES: hypothetical protein [Pseudomonas]|uniref:hypothetical protein n=2 Tax=Pseudomonas TaxID=286 RepID=UPI001F5D73D1|nr:MULTISPECIES: hypothetical protein [Pseudomonas]MDO4234714.1 hypothetical protein [Pseudomonas sp.]